MYPSAVVGGGKWATAVLGVRISVVGGSGYAGVVAGVTVSYTGYCVDGGCDGGDDDAVAGNSGTAAVELFLGGTAAGQRVIEGGFGFRGG